jgi:hypothetical protein
MRPETSQSMNRRGRRSGRRPLSLVALPFVSLLCLVAFVGTAHATPRLRCGSPTKRGYVDVVINLKKGGENTSIVMRDIYFPTGTPAADKASFIADLINLLDHETHIHADHANGSSDIELFGLYDWEVSGHIINQDGTGEPDWLAYDGSSAGGEALCSLSGTATGTSPTGGQGVAGIQAFGAQAQVTTQPGMPAQVVEQMLMQQFQSQNVPVRWAVPQDFTGPFANILHDESVLVIGSPNENAPGYITNVVLDDGLALDVMAIADPSEPTSEVPSVGAGLAPLRLEVSPSVFSSGTVTVRYSSDAAEGTRGGGGIARLTAIDVTGRSIATLFERAVGGAGTVSWDGTDQYNRPIPAGVYFLRLETPSGAVVSRVTRVR